MTKKTIGSRYPLLDAGHRGLPPSAMKKNTNTMEKVLEDYLGVHLDTRLYWRCNTETVYKKGHEIFFFLDNLQCLLQDVVFYKSVVVSAVCFAAISWGSRIRKTDSKKLNNLIRKKVSVLGTVLEPMDNTVPPLHDMGIKQWLLQYYLISVK